MFPLFFTQWGIIVINYEMSPKTNAVYETGGGVGGVQKKRNSMICEEEIREGFMEERPFQLICKGQVWFEEAVIQETDHPTVTPVTNGEYFCTFSLGLQYEFQAFVGYSTGNGTLLRAGIMILHFIFLSSIHGHLFSASAVSQSLLWLNSFINKLLFKFFCVSWILC